MVVIGLLASVAGGKTTVARMLAASGATVIDADALAHMALGDPDVRASVVAQFGATVLRDPHDRDSQIDRAALARHVFGAGSFDDRRALESIIHPWVRARIRIQLDAARANGTAVVVLDIPLLLGSPFEADADVIVFVDTPPNIRADRAHDARDWDRAELDRRDAAQPTEADKRACAAIRIDNSGSLEQTRRQVVALYAEWVGPPD